MKLLNLKQIWMRDWGIFVLWCVQNVFSLRKCEKKTRKSKMDLEHMWKKKKIIIITNKNKFTEHQRSIKAKKSAASAATDYLDFPELDLDESELEEEGSEVDSEPELRQFFFGSEVHKKNNLSRRFSYIGTIYIGTVPSKNILHILLLWTWLEGWLMSYNHEKLHQHQNQNCLVSRVLNKKKGIESYLL